MQYEEIEKIVRLFEDSSLTEMEVAEGNLHIRLSKNKTNTIVEDTVPQEESGEIIRAEMIGTFYAAPEAGAEPYVKAGSSVSKGDILCIIEAMKIMHEIRAPYDCVIEEVLVCNEDVVAYDQPLFKVRGSDQA